MSNIKTVRYTYVDFAEEVKGIITGGVEVTPEIAERVTEKANALIATNTKKAAYSKTKAAATAPKGPRPETLERANAIASVLSTTPMTASEISEAMGKEVSPLVVANAMRYLDHVVTQKVTRKMTTKDGLMQERLYSAYSVKAEIVPKD